MPFWLGPPGKLQQLPYPSRGLNAPRVRAGAVHVLANGGAATDVLGRQRRYDLSWRYLGGRTGQSGAGVLDALERLYEGAYGPGPFALIDSARPNLLTVNASTTTSARRDTLDWAASWATAPGTLASLAAATQTGNARALTAAMTAGTGIATVWAARTATGPTEPYASCVLPSLPYTASVYAARTGGAQSAAARLIFYTAAGIATGGITTGSVTALSTGSWVRLTASANAPSDAAYALLSVLPSAVTMPSTLLLDGAQLEQVAAATAWTLGTGTPRVVFDQLADSYPLMTLHDVAVTLLEVG